MTVHTNNLNKAAFYTVFGARVTQLIGQYPEHTFVLTSSKWLTLYEQYIGIVSYRKFSNQRIRLKRLSRKQSGLPEKFTGNNKGFNFMEIAHVK